MEDTVPGKGPMTTHPSPETLVPGDHSALTCCPPRPRPGGCPGSRRTHRRPQRIWISNPASTPPCAAREARCRQRLTRTAGCPARPAPTPREVAVPVQRQWFRQRQVHQSPAVAQAGRCRLCVDEVWLDVASTFNAPSVRARSPLRWGLFPLRTARRYARGPPGHAGHRLRNRQACGIGLGPQRTDHRASVSIHHVTLGKQSGDQ